MGGIGSDSIVVTMIDLADFAEIELVRECFGYWCRAGLRGKGAIVELTSVVRKDYV